jgi:hypothetical protein
MAELGVEEEDGAQGAPDSPPPALLLPFARRDLERLRLILLAQRRLREAHGPASARMIAAKSYFEDAVRWLEIHGGGDGRELAAEWRYLASHLADVPAEPAPAGEPRAGAPAAGGDPSRRRRRRRRRRRPRSEPVPPA